MLAPHELKNKPFSKAIKGYNPVEVDEYIDFLIGKYTEAYRENNELERKLHVVVTNLDEIKDEEESIRSTLIQAQKMAERIVRDATERADAVTSAVQERCDVVLAEFHEQLEAEKQEMWALRSRIVEFKKELFDQYKDHIAAIKEVSVNELDEILLPDENELVSKIFTEVKQGIRENDANEIKKPGALFEKQPKQSKPEVIKESEVFLPEQTENGEDPYIQFMTGDEKKPSEDGSDEQ